MSPATASQLFEHLIHILRSFSQFPNAYLNPRCEYPEDQSHFTYLTSLQNFFLFPFSLFISELSGRERPIIFFTKEVELLAEVIISFIQVIQWMELW